MTNEEAINVLRGQVMAYGDTLSEAEHKAFDKAVEALEGKDKDVHATWISVNDRLPDKSGYYLILSDNGRANVLSYSVRHKAFNAFDLFEDARYALLCTHWMPLPESPKSET